MNIEVGFKDINFFVDAFNLKAAQLMVDIENKHLNENRRADASNDRAFYLSWIEELKKGL